MKNVLLFAAVLAVSGAVCAFVSKKDAAAPQPPEGGVPAAETAVKWHTWEEAIKANQSKQKTFYVDFYTDWCGWCKKMDASTFSDPSVAAYLNEHFYPVKFNAEQKADIVFDGQTFSWQPGGRNGYHALAYSLLDGRLGYPSSVYLTPTFERILTSPGYKPATDFQKEMKFVAEGHYATTTWEEFKKKN